ncbi:MAG TPA: hypothetical protein VMF58_09235 [Rhizomicrobium sp.]|nr:hypothetical protein [Rhizomicrobium sp.]
MIRKLVVVSACILLAACANNRAAIPDRVALPPPPPAGEPPNVIGLSADAMRATFGTPAFVRKDGDSEFWRYNGATCRAFFFLYKQNNILTVGHAETLPHGAAIAADNSCINALRLHPLPLTTS